MVNKLLSNKYVLYYLLPSPKHIYHLHYHHSISPFISPSFFHFKLKNLSVPQILPTTDFSPSTDWCHGFGPFPRLFAHRFLWPHMRGMALYFTQVCSLFLFSNSISVVNEQHSTEYCHRFSSEQHYGRSTAVNHVCLLVPFMLNVIIICPVIMKHRVYETRICSGDSR